MSAYFNRRQDFATLLVSGWGLISFLKLSLLLDWTTTARQGSAPEYRIRHVPALGLLGRERGTTNDASGLALVIHGSKMGSGT